MPAGELHAEGRRIAGKIATRPYGSLTATKRLMRDAERLVAQMDQESTVFVDRLASAEAKEAFLAFAEKRRPDFTKIPR
jgi:1,4-dihydroxy-2-naphthoyl-CoA synthase